MQKDNMTVILQIKTIKVLITKTTTQDIKAAFF